MDKKSFYITTTIPYVNADLHVGHAVEFVQADVIARFKRLDGYEVFYNAGTDEHGQKIWEAAAKVGEDVRTFVDRYAEAAKNLKPLLNLSYDNFIRTTDPEHITASQELWKLCDASGDIEKRKYKGLYCTGCEKYLSERDMVGGKCVFHPKQELTVIEEDNYFFKFSRHKDFLREYLSRENVIVPLHRLKEARQLVEELDDFSISREKSKLPWGVPVPGDESQVMYVWFDALTNYISTLGWPKNKEKFEKFWQGGEVIQTAGKDQVRFQSVMWPAMLHSASIKPPDQIFYHGFINSGGQRMSKSLGNVISPKDLVEKYGTDATRFQLLRNVHPTEDTDITWERLDEWHNAYLVNGLGNLVARVMKMAEDNNVTPLFYDEPYLKPIIDAIREYRFNDAMDTIWSKIQHLDQNITDEKPYKVVKENPALGKSMIQQLVLGLHEIAVCLEPFMPETSRIIKEAVKANKKPDNLFERVENLGMTHIDDVTKNIGFSVSKDVLDKGITVALALCNVPVVKKRRSKEFDEMINNLVNHTDIKVQLASPILKEYRCLYEGLELVDPIPPAEHLLKIIGQNADLPNLNNVVDTYNAVSVSTLLSLGAHDLKYIKGNVRFVLTTGDEKYTPLGKTKPSKVNKGEYACMDDEKIICRMDLKQCE